MFLCFRLDILAVQSWLVDTPHVCVSGIEGSRMRLRSYYQDFVLGTTKLIVLALFFQPPRAIPIRNSDRRHIRILTCGAREVVGRRHRVL